MNRRRTFTLTLTEAQYDALADAMCLADVEDDHRCDEDGPSMAFYRKQRRARNAAWARINAGWYGDKT